jgi:hypothetical protein
MPQTKEDTLNKTVIFNIKQPTERKRERIDEVVIAAV